MKIHFEKADFEDFVRQHVGRLYEGYEISNVEFTGRYGSPELTVTLEKAPRPAKHPLDEHTDCPIPEETPI